MGKRIRSGRSKPEAREALVSLGLAALTLLVYRDLAGAQFITFDDHQHVAENVRVAGGLTLANVRWALTTGYASNWQPLTWLVHMTMVQLFGLNAGAHHLLNASIHALNAVLLFHVLFALTGSRGPSAFVAALFAVHPLHVESVAWVSELKDVLSTCFWFLTMGAYAWYARRPSIRRYLPTVAFFAAGLAAKPMLVTLPLVLLLLDFWPLGRLRIPGDWRRDARRLVLEKLPLLALALPVSVITYTVQEAAGSVGSLEELPFRLRLANALVSCVRYLGMTVWPSGLAVFYPHPGPALPVSHAVASAAFLIAVSVAVCSVARRHPYLIVGWLWYLGTLVPVLGLVQVGSQGWADRYTYVPLVGVFIAVSWGASALLGRRKAPRWIAPLGTVALLAVLGWRTTAQVGFWSDGITLFRHALEVTEENPTLLNMMGTALEREGLYGESEDMFRKALGMKPDYPVGLANLGAVLLKQRRFTESEAVLRKALERRPGDPKVLGNLGQALAELGRDGEAEIVMGKAAGSDPDSIEALSNLAGVLVRQRRFDEAETVLRRALGVKPDSVELLSNLGGLLGEQQRYGEAEVLLRSALQLKPDDRGALDNLVMLLRIQNRDAEAEAVIRRTKAR